MRLFFCAKTPGQRCCRGLIDRSKGETEPESEPCEDSVDQPSSFALSKAAP